MERLEYGIEGGFVFAEIGFSVRNWGHHYVKRYGDSPAVVGRQALQHGVDVEGVAARRRHFDADVAQRLAQEDGENLTAAANQQQQKITVSETEFVPSVAHFFALIELIVAEFIIRNTVSNPDH